MTSENYPATDRPESEWKPPGERVTKLESEIEIVKTKQFRVELDAVLQKIKTAKPSRERALAITKLQETVMWLGMDLKERNAPNPYPNSYNPANAIVEPTADGLKL